MTDKVAFKDGDKEVVAQRGVKLTNKNSRPAQISRQKAEAREQFEQHADQFMVNQDRRKDAGLQLAQMFMKALKDKTLSSNRGVIASDFETEMRKKWVNLAIEINNDPDEEYESMGSVALLNLLMKAILYQRDRINELEYRIAKKENGSSQSTEEASKNGS
jgi:hypothetical protein